MQHPVCMTLCLDIAPQFGQLQGLGASTKLARSNTRGAATLSVRGARAMSDSLLASCTMRCQISEGRERPEPVRRYGIVSKHCRRGLKRALLLRQYAMALISSSESCIRFQISIRQCFPAYDLVDHFGGRRILLLMVACHHDSSMADRLFGSIKYISTK